MGVAWRGPATLPPGSLGVYDRKDLLNNYEHKKLIEAIAKIDEVPTDPQDFSEWIKAEGHLAFLRQNALGGELVVYAAGDYTFIHSVAVSNDRLMPIDKEDIMGWSFNPYTSIASYVTGGGRDDVWIERGLSAPHPGSIVLHDCIEPLGLTITEAAAALGVTRTTLSELVNGRRGISAEMAVRLSKVFGGSAESWLVQQVQYDLAHVSDDRFKQLKRLAA